MRRIEIEFAIDVELTDEQEKQLHALVHEITAAHQPVGQVHWVSGMGQKPLWSDADIRAFGNLPGGRSGKPSGEPEWDESTLQYSTSVRNKQ